MLSDILPPNSSSWEIAVAKSIAYPQVISDAVDAIRKAKLVSPPPSFLPWLVMEYGLDELTPYVPNLYDLIDQGIDWQRVRGTPKALEIGLEWIGYFASIKEAAARRRFWNEFQLYFSALPANDNPDLDRIDGITGLSVPLRSRFRRGVYEYDIGAAEIDYSRLDHVMLDRESGVRLREDGPLWSFGRTYELQHTLTEADGVAIGNWIAPIVGGGGVRWADLNIPWTDADFAWAGGEAEIRAAALAAWMQAQVLHLVFKDADGAAIGYRPIRIGHRVKSLTGGAYTVGGLGYEPDESGTAFYIEVKTDPGVGIGSIATSIAVLISATIADDAQSGARWLSPEQVSGGAEFGSISVTIPFRQTVRERVQYLLRF